MNDNLSQKVYTADCLSILSERTVRFLAVIKALIGDQREYSLLAGLWRVLSQSENCCSLDLLSMAIA